MFEKIKSNFTWVSIIYVVLGLVLLFWPAASMLVICRLFGTALMIFGVVKLVMHVISGGDEFIAYADVSTGVIAAVLGLLLLVRPQMFISILPMLLGILIVVDSAMRVQSTWALRKVGYGRWWIELIFAAVTLVLGILLVVNPFEGMSMAVSIMGAFLLLDGIANLFDIFYISRKIGKRFK